MSEKRVSEVIFWKDVPKNVKNVFDSLYSGIRRVDEWETAEELSKTSNLAYLVNSGRKDRFYAGLGIIEKDKLLNRGLMFILEDAEYKQELKCSRVIVEEQEVEIMANPLKDLREITNYEKRVWAEFGLSMVRQYFERQQNKLKSR